MSKNRCLVSIYCLVYNHEKYVKDALEGFVTQKTNFPFEVIVHDDASTDNSASIIREYEKLYPDIIKPIYQTENQYSKGIEIFEKFILPKINGKYTGICEGDDYWCDENKLQLQVDILEKNTNYSACVHSTAFYNCNSGKTTYPYTCESNKVYEVKDVIPSGSAAYQTSSLIYRTKYRCDNPEFLFMIKGVGDYPLSLHLASKGTIYYIAKVMSVYRRNVPNSWSSRHKRKNNIDKVKFDKNINELLDSFNQFTEYKYQDLVLKTQIKNNFLICLEEKDVWRIKNTSELKEYYRSLSKKEKLKYQIKLRCPHVYIYMQKIKEKIT